MKFLTRTDATPKTNLKTAMFMFAAMMTVALSFFVSQSASALSTDTTSPTAPGIPSTATPTRQATMQWTWGAAIDLPGDPTIDDASGIKGYQYELTSGTDIITPWTDVTSTTATTVAPYDGVYQLHVRALDNAGNPAGPESVGTATFDQTGPQVFITAPTNGTTVDSTNKITITGTTGDAVSYTLSIGATGQTPVLFTSANEGFGSYVWDTTGVPGKSYIATLTGYDEAGNASSTDVLIVVGSSAAPFAVTAATSKFTSRPMVLTGTVSSSATKISISILDSRGRVVETGTASYVAGSTTWTYTIKGLLSNGAYTVQVHALTTGGFADALAPMTVDIRCDIFGIIRYILNLFSWCW